MAAVAIWLIAGIVLIAAEVLSGAFVLLMLGGGALAAALSAGLGAPPLVDALIFGAVSILLLLVARPAIQRRMHAHHTLTGIDALIGGSAMTVSTVDAHGGQVKIGGDVWSARSYDHDQVIEAGQRVTVMSINGATAVVFAE
jgi:membrane protein implicated in regulation of membrane protease activity